ncbi:NADPH-dependent 7-cyano-7-deazaguanine reductase QueF [Oleiagrimonas citrea]|jgi:7-cyano-7-deazaguanine reductase|uniref:NADPH-dependent 7-cyano-7-deazaguanine reductase n=1 Tax=Oleiagrimonas citrea TaxID=1665687 RepID=A0A846ZMG7_9GAMM|nr:NADPH-dependent 7-cyano-7-deazaguanine reductase QueF [Oleiagrimonas citrea]NKZ38653.1 NADPH-dependent 7-cyano-7-deazaguanine reductase QueF [Oleiagrimonas citrea]
MTTPEDSQLGKATAYRNRYAPDLLFPIPRSKGRAELGLHGNLPFQGVDIWNAYELSWLDPRGKPVVALAEFHVPSDSPAIIESKSFKLYLNSFSGERLDEATLVERLARDLGEAAGAPVAVHLTPAADFGAQRIEEPEGVLIDALDLDIDVYGPPDPSFLRADTDAAPVRETLLSNLLKSNCPVTGQPDWASLRIDYVGAPIDREGLLRYIVSFREHREFHEHCVERIFMDLIRHCAPARLDVSARYTRRGGLDINPFRSSESGHTPGNPRGARQ